MRERGAHASTDTVLEFLVILFVGWGQELGLYVTAYGAYLAVLMVRGVERLDSGLAGEEDSVVYEAFLGQFIEIFYHCVI